MLKIPRMVALWIALFLPSVGSAETSGLWDSIVNYERTFQCPEAELIAPESAEEVQIIVQRALETGRKIMTGTKKFSSQIDAACAGSQQIQITTERLNRIIKIDKDKKLVTTQSGVRLSELNNVLREEQLSINMISEGGFFTVGGMLGSDTHGSTMTQPVSLSEYITSMTMVDGLGQIRKIEGDELLATRVNLGVLGVVVEATFRVEPLKKVQARIYKGHDRDLEKVIASLPREHYSASLSWFPGIRRYTATTFDFVPNNTPGEAVNKQAEFPDWVYDIYRKAAQYSNQPNRPFAECGLARIREGLRSKSYFKENDKPVKNAVGWSDDMQYFKCSSKGACPWDKIPIVVGGFSIPMAELSNWIGDVRKIFDAHSSFLHRPCLALNGIYFRFGAGTDAWLAMNEGRETVFIDLEYIANTKGAEDDGKLIRFTKIPKSYPVVQEIEQMSLQKYNARPHWGKNLPSAFFDVGKDQYSNWDRFLQYKKKVDPQNVFSNPWWERLVDGETASLKSRYQNCALDGSCICTNDSHCPDSYVCSPGKFWEKARICKRP